MGAPPLRSFGPTRARSLALTAAGALLLCAARAHATEAALTLVLAGRTERVVAAGRGIAMLRDGAVSLLDGDGRVVGRCGGGTATAGRPKRPDHTALSAEEVLADAGFSDEDVSPEAEDVLDDEGLDPPPRHRLIDTSAGAPRALDIAGTPDAVWIGTSEGLWRLGAAADIGPVTCARVGLGDHAVERVAAAGTRVVAISSVTVWRRDDVEAGFAVAGVLTSRPRALALAADGTVFVADEDGVVALWDARGSRRVLAEPVDDLVTCGAHVLALADDRVVRLDTDGGATPVGARPPARAFACASPDGSRLLAAGVGLWSSADDAPWLEETAGLGRSFASVAWAAGRTWLAADGEQNGGLFVTSPDGAPAIALAPTPRSADRRPPTWAALLPRLAFAGSGWTESNGVTGWRVWLLMTFSLNRFEVRRAARQLEDFR